MSINLSTRVGALENDLSEVKSGVADLKAMMAALLDAQAPAKTVTPAKTEPKAPASTKAYRSAKAKDAAKAQVSALWTKTLKDAKVTKRAQLTDAQFEAYQAGAKAIWASAPKTRSTKA